MNDLKVEFQRWQSEGFLGDPAGEVAYAYLRASSEKQVEEGSSFPRQIENVHKAALRDHLRIPFDHIYFDDGYSGFEFEHRPALLKLRHLLSGKGTGHLILEDIDRLSRNADWQQGFLLEELTRHKVEVHFYISPGSQLERYVRGYIAQEGMRKDIQRMKDGQKFKALDGRVTAKKRRFGYNKTHPVDTHYELHPEESKIVRLIYEMVIYERKTLQQIATYLNNNHIKTWGRVGYWNVATLLRMIKSPAYKGEFIANAVMFVTTGYNANGRPKHKSVMRPESEWIRVECPAIVTPEEWDLAIEILRKNCKSSLRNGRRNWLLQTICKCAICRDYYMVTGRGGSNNSPQRYYFCGSRVSERARMENRKCGCPSVRAELLEARVWEEVRNIIFNPDLIIQRIEERAANDWVQGIQGQLDYVEKELAQIEKERAKFEAAYRRDIYTLDEFEERMKDLRGKAQTLELNQAKLQARIAEAENADEQKKTVLQALKQLQATIGTEPDLPFDLKRKIITLLCENIWVNTCEGTFTIEGEISGTFEFQSALRSPECGWCRLRGSFE